MALNTVKVPAGMEPLFAKAEELVSRFFQDRRDDPERGTIFDLGFDFYEAGRQAGFLAADVLGGADPAAIPVRDVGDVVRRRFLINLKSLRGLKDPWRVPDDLLREADVVVDETGVHTKAVKKP